MLYDIYGWQDVFDNINHAPKTNYQIELVKWRIENPLNTSNLIALKKSKAVYHRKHIEELGEPLENHYSKEEIASID